MTETSTTKVDAAGKQRRPRLRRLRSFTALLAATLAVTVGSATLAPATAHAAAAPTYKIEAVKFVVNDEQNPETVWVPFVGDVSHDEVYWVFNSVGNPGATNWRYTKTFTGLDDGDSRTFSTTTLDRCIFRYNCTGQQAGPAGIGVSIQLFEEDAGQNAEIAHNIASAFTTVGAVLDKVPVISWIGKAASVVGTAIDLFSGGKDDHLGTQTFTYSKARLAVLKRPGDHISDWKRFHAGGDGDYSLELKVTRVS